MLLVDRAMLHRYEEDDIVLQLIQEITEPSDAAFMSHAWLLDSASKRLVWNLMYGSLIDSRHTPVLRVLDIGGGYSALTRPLLDRHDYTLVDIMAHDDHDALREREASLGASFWAPQDWLTFQPDGNYDIVVANDLFPNVDQRLEEFLGKYIPICREVRLSLTFYNTPRYYKVKRVDGDEIFWIAAWDASRTIRALERWSDRLSAFDTSQLLETTESIFPNGRQVAIARLKGAVEE